MPTKPKLSVYWASSCGGCEIAVVNLHDRILEVDRHFDFFFCPCLLDTKKADVEALPDSGIAITLFNGAIRTEENLEMARLMRAKSEVLIAFGACAAAGGIPALSNFHLREQHLNAIYLGAPGLDNASGTVPRETSEVPEGVLHLPAFHERVRALDQVVEVDYYMPGCPPEPHRIWEVIEAIVSGAPLPPRGSVLGAGASSVCAECARSRSDKSIPRLHRTFEIVPDSERCLLEQGLVCMGIATREGCGALCPQVNMPCIGCYGPPPDVRDQGAAMIAALGSVLAPVEYSGVTPEELRRSLTAAYRAVPDGAGVYYKFSAAKALLGGRS